MRNVLFLVASCCLMTACDLEDRLIAKQEEKYNESFKEVFGNIDPEHTWSMVENNTVAVNLDEASRVKIYAKMDRTYYLVGDYENVSGSKELSYDAPRGCEDILVTVNGAPLLKNGSRAILCSNDPSKIVYADNSTDEHVRYHYYTYSQIKAFHGDVGHLPENEPNDSKIKKDYVLVSEGRTYTFSPTYWNAINDHKFGLFYYTNFDAKEYVQIPFYQNKGDEGEHNELQYLNPSTGNWVSLKEDYAYHELFSVIGAPKYEDDVEMLRAQHFHINIPEKTIFGFYVETSDGSTFFSDSRLNSTVVGGNPDFSAFGHIEIDGFTYIVVEDMDYIKNPSPSTEPDYNDFVFTMKGLHEHINTTEPISYLYATEDLGGTDDFDFNDVIFSVSHVSGQPNATVKLMAAGGILPAEIWFEDNNSGVSTKVGGKEIHDAFGVEAATMVNTTSITKDFVTLGEVEVGENWSHLAFTNAGNGFKVKVIKKNVTLEVGTPGANNGEAPQMLILNRDWLWPTERTRISTAYPDFDQWGANYLDYLCVNNWDSNKVVNRDLTDEYPHAH